MQTVFERSPHIYKADIASGDADGVKVRKTYDGLLFSKCRVFEPTGGHGSRGKGGDLHRSSPATETDISGAASKLQERVVVGKNDQTNS